MRTVLATLCWLWWVVAASCHAGPGASVDASAGSTKPGLMLVPDEARDEPGATADHDRTGAAGVAERMLIQRGQLRLEVARPAEALREFVARVGECGGFLQSQQGSTVVVRVPAPRFDELFAAGRAMGRVLAESREASDVTEEFLDLGIRIDNARKARDRLLALLARAERVEDVLKIEAELRRLTEEIERMEGRSRFLADQVAMATLQVAFVAPTEPPPSQRRAGKSRFPWLDRVGPEAVMGGF